MKANADCSFSITGYPIASKTSQALCYRRLNAIRAYLTETGGNSEDRISISFQIGGGAANTVDIRTI